MTEQLSTITAPALTIRCNIMTPRRVELALDEDRVTCKFSIVLTNDGDCLTHADSFPCSEIPRLLAFFDIKERIQDVGVIIHSASQSTLSLYGDLEDKYFGFESFEEGKYWVVPLDQDKQQLLRGFLARALACCTVVPEPEDDMVPRIGLS